ncbi:hypothetical protein D3C86_1392430 [compost metagenome]
MAQGDHLQRIGQGAGHQGDAEAQQQDRGRQQGRARRRDAERQDDQGGGAHAQRHRLTRVHVRQALAEDDVEGPAQAGEGSESHTNGVQPLDPAPDRQQHGQTRDGQADQGEMHQFARMDQGQGQRTAELDGDGQAQGDGPQRHVEAEVHQA